MKIEEAIRIEEEAHKRRMKIRIDKASDYAKEDADCLSNFKVMAELYTTLEDRGYGINMGTPHGVAMWHVLHKIVRTLNLWNEGKAPRNESLEDTHDDHVNYVDLAKECYEDYMKEHPK